MWRRFSRAVERALHPPQTHRIHVDEQLAEQSLSLSILQCLAAARVEHERITVVCVGTDRSTGDALGPLVGARLADMCRGRNGAVRVLGTLDEPVHATNLHDVVTDLRRAPDAGRRSIIAIDACLGRTESVGYISVKRGPLHPGTGVHKSLPAVGDFHIMGVVNVGGFMEYFVLQNTRLSFVMRMADVIAAGLRIALEQWQAAGEAAVSRPEPS